MAQKVEIKFLDDIDGTEGAETITFGLDGRTYEIDLTQKNEAKLRKFLQTYIDAGRKTKTSTEGSSGRRTTRSATRGSQGPDLAKVRAWAAENGFEVKDRGRVPAKVMEAYNNAQG